MVFLCKENLKEVFSHDNGWKLISRKIGLLKDVDRSLHFFDEENVVPLNNFFTAFIKSESKNFKIPVIDGENNRLRLLNIIILMQNLKKS